MKFSKSGSDKKRQKITGAFAGTRQMHINGRTRLRSAGGKIILLTLFSVLLLFVLDVVIGSTHISLVEVGKVIREALLGGHGGGEEKEALSGGQGGEYLSEGVRQIILRFRLPRAVTAAAGGAGLALAGLLLQTLFRNPLAGPSVLGITAGANLGVAAAVLLLGGGAFSGFTSALQVGGRLLITLASVGGAAGVLLIVLAVARFVGSATVVLLFGIMFGYAANSMVSILIHFSSAERVQSYIQWSFGSFDTTMWSDIGVLLPVLAVSVAASLVLIKPLNLFLLGHEYAGTMGISVRRVRLLLILIASLSAGVVHAFCGPVSFLGVAVPHMARGLTSSSNHELLVPEVILLGAGAALAADIISHLPGGPSILPLNAVTALIGAPVLIWVLLKSRGGRVQV